MEPVPRSESFYPFVTRTLLELAEAGALTNVVRIEVEPRFGFVSRISYSDGSVRLTRGGDVGLNSSAVNAVLSDKEYTKDLLVRSGFRCPQGRAFLLSWWAETIKSSLSSRGYTGDLLTTADVSHYVEDELGLPVYVKPVDGSKGAGVHRCADHHELAAACAALDTQRHKVILVEEAVPWPDYRLVVLGNTVISAYRRDPLAVTGTGAATVVDLIERRVRDDHSVTIDAGDPRILSALRRAGRDLFSIPAAGERVELLSISNLSAGGTAEDISDSINVRWMELALDIGKACGAVLCGIDIACDDISAPLADYAVLEVNGSPGLDNYARVGPEQNVAVRALYTRVFNTSPLVGAAALSND